MALKRQGWLALACVIALVSVAEAQEPATRPATTRPAVSSFDSVADACAALSSSDWKTRAAAQRYLMMQPPEIREHLEFMLIKTKDPEVIGRLSAVAVHLYLKGETAFDGPLGVLGISMSESLYKVDKDGSEQYAITIMALQPGFPAAEVLEAEDQIIALNGAPFTDSGVISSFRTAVMANKPGTSVKLTVIRAGVTKEIRVRLAGVPESAALTLESYVQDRMIKADAYREHLRELRGVGVSAVIDSPDQQTPQLARPRIRVLQGGIMVLPQQQQNGPAGF